MEYFIIVWLDINSDTKHNLDLYTIYYTRVLLVKSALSSTWNLLLSSLTAKATKTVAWTWLPSDLLALPVLAWSSNCPD